MKRKKSGGVYEHLSKSGLLEHGNPEEIEREKAAYWRNYRREHKKAWRKSGHSVTIMLDDAENALVKGAAQIHSVSKTGFVKEAVLAFIMIIGLSSKRSEHDR